MLNRTIAPPIHDAVSFTYHLPALQTTTLQNGIPLYWLHAGVQEVIEVNWVLPAGIWQEDKPSVAQATAALLKSGTSTKTSQQINESFEFYGANLQVSCGNDWVTISLYTLKKHLGKLLPVVLELLTDAVFPEEEFLLYQQNTTQKLLVNLKQCDFVANQKIDAVIFGEEHPYGRYTQKESIASLSRTAIHNHYQRHYQNAPLKIFLSGQVGAEEIKMIDSIFGSTVVRQATTNDVKHTISPHPLKKQLITNDPNGVQGAIRIGKKFINRQHQDFSPMVVLNTVLGGYFGSRLMSNIREEKGFTYGIYSAQIPFKNEGVFMIQTEVGKEVIEPALKEIYFEMNRLCEELISEEELLLVKNYLLGNLLGDLDGPFQIMQRWRTLILNGFDETYFNKNIQTYKTISPQELKILANRYFNTDDLYEIVVV